MASHPTTNPKTNTPASSIRCRWFCKERVTVSERKLGYLSRPSRSGTLIASVGAQSHAPLLLHHLIHRVWAKFSAISVLSFQLVISSPLVALSILPLRLRVTNYRSFPPLAQYIMDASVIVPLYVYPALGAWDPVYNM
jgi:hypothetical protein